MKNITLTVPDEIYLLARVHAARQGTSVSASSGDSSNLWTNTRAGVLTFCGMVRTKNRTIRKKGYPPPPISCVTVKL